MVVRGKEITPIPHLPETRDFLKAITKSVKGSMRWIGQDWHWAKLGGLGALTLAAISQKENISQAALMAWEQIHPTPPVTQSKDASRGAFSQQPETDHVLAISVTPTAEVSVPEKPDLPPPPAITASSGSDNPELKDDPEKETKPKPKELPDVINSETTQFVSLSPAEVQKLIDEAAATEEFKMLMPKIIQNNTLQEVQGQGNTRILVVSGNTEKTQTFELPALMPGEIIEVHNGNLFSVLGVKGGNGAYGFIFPASSTIRAEKGEVITQDKVGENLVSVTYDPNTEAVRNFRNFLKKQAPKAPSNTLFIIAGESGTPGLTIKNIRTSHNGEVITVGR